MNKVLKLAVVAAILIFAATVILLKAFVGQDKVVVVTQNISPGTVLTEKMITEKDIPTFSRVTGSYLSMANLIGKTLLVSRFKNDQIGSEMVGNQKREIKDGEGIITINISKADANNIKPGDSISIITYQNNGETKETSGFKVNYIAEGNQRGNGQEEYILTLTNQLKNNEVIAPFIKNGNYKLEVVGG